MITYARDDNGVWRQITDDEEAAIETLVNCLKLGLGESPFYANYGIPFFDAIETQVEPSVYVNRLREKFLGWFASIEIKIIDTASYEIDVMTIKGKRYGFTI